MLTDIHEGKINEEVSVNSSGDNVVVSATPDSWIYVHELIGDAVAPVTLTVKAGSRVLAEFTLGGGQGLTLDDVPGDDGVPRFKCLPGEDFILNLSGGVQFTGAIQYSRRY